MRATATDTVHTQTPSQSPARKNDASAEISRCSRPFPTFQTLYSPMGLIRHPFNISDIIV